MTDAPIHFGALDAALLPIFFISYSVFGLVQLGNLFGDRFALFAGLAVGAWALAQGSGLLGFAGFCADTPSLIVCGGEGRGLVGFGMVWVHVSAATLAMFGFVSGIRAVKRAWGG